MLEKYQKKLINFMIFMDLPKMKKSLPQDYGKLVKIQNRRIRALMKAAYKHPFYRERFEKGGGGILYIPSQRPVLAYFQELRMIAADIGRVVRYSFVFVECSGNPANERDTYIISDGVKRLWDHSYESGIDIEVLLELNPDVKRPDVPILPGRTVKLC